MPWLQLILEMDSRDYQDAVEETLLASGALAVSYQGDPIDSVLEPPSGSHFRMIGLYEDRTDMEAVMRSLQSHLGGDLFLRSRVEVLEDQEWVRSWMKDFHPMKFGSRLWVCPSWTTPPEPGAVNILIDPGLGFGTGTHPTTSLCLEWLEGLDLRKRTVIDYGSGSGILAIAAAKLGAGKVWAVDQDPLALEALEENVSKNEVGGIVTPVSPEALPEIRAEFLVSNILAGVLIPLAPLFAERLKKGGRIALSGLLEEDEEKISQAYREGFVFNGKTLRQGWLLLEGFRV
jgi:ribosomal protein L11 methyltransferase